MKSGTSSSVWPPLQSARLLDQVRERIRYLHYSLRTEESYLHWIRAFIRFHGRRHPRELGGEQVEAFLMWLANERNVAVSTHRQALSALLFLYQKVLGLDLPWMQSIGRPQRKARLPVVLSADAVARVLAQLQGEHRLLAQMLYGTGMRITEALQLRVKDVDFERRTLIVRCGKGGKDRALMLPEAAVPALREQMARARLLWAADAASGCGAVCMPDALLRKYPRAGASWSWFWVFPQATHSTDARSGVVRRHHLYDQTFQRAFKRAVHGAGIEAPATPHTLRHYVPRRTMSTRVAFYLRQLPIVEGHSRRATTARSRTRAACRPADTDRPWRRAVSSSRAPSPSVRGWPPGTSASSRSTRVPATAR